MKIERCAWSASLIGSLPPPFLPFTTRPLVLKLIGEPKERVHIRVDIVRPNGDVLGKIEGTGELGDDGTSQLNLGMRGLPLPDFGIYAFNIYIDDQFEKTIGITVARTPEKTPAGGEGTRR